MNPRRTFLSRLGLGATAFGAVFGRSVLHGEAQSPTAPESRWQPARHEEDDWFDQVPGKHRAFFDSRTPEELEDALQFTGNYFSANRGGYGLGDGDLAVIICVRHRSAPFAFNDAMWAKYGQPLSDRAEFVDPKTKQAPSVNLKAAQFTRLANRGVRLAVCDLSTRAIAGIIARKVGAKTDEIYPELIANRLQSARQVPAGIVAVNRAQERGYTSM